MSDYEPTNEQIRITKLYEFAGRYKLSVSTLKEPLVVSISMVFKHRLKKGIVITRPQLEQLIAEAEVDECDRLVGRMLGYREHSVGEVRFKLKQKEIGPDAVESVVSKYVRNGLLDDRRFAEMLARRTLEKKPSGRTFIIAELQKRRVDRSLAERVVDDLLEDRDETSLAVEALERKWHLYAQIDIESARKKAYNYLSRRGIGYGAAKAAFETLHRRRREETED